MSQNPVPEPTSTTTPPADPPPTDLPSPAAAGDPAAAVGESAVVDVVPGDPPVPVNIWRLPAGEAAAAEVGARLAQRLLAEYTRPGELVHDTLPAAALAHAARGAGRVYRTGNRFTNPADRAALVVAGWPSARDAGAVLERLRRRLRPGGFLAVVIAGNDDAAVEIGPLVAAATATGLGYLQHVVTMPDDPTHSTAAGGHAPGRVGAGDASGRTGVCAARTGAAGVADAAGAAAVAGGRGGLAAHQRVHGDVLIFTRPEAADG